MEGEILFKSFLLELRGLADALNEEIQNGEGEGGQINRQNLRLSGS